MSFIPARRKRSRSGILRSPRLVWPRHEKWVRGHDCCVPGCKGEPIVFAHVRNAANAGTAIKSHSSFGRSLCYAHHEEEHGSTDAFDAKYGINRYQQAAWFMQRSPDVAMRESFHELPDHVKRQLLDAAA